MTSSGLPLRRATRAAAAFRDSVARGTAARGTVTRGTVARGTVAGGAVLSAAVLLSGCGGTSTPAAAPTATVTTTVQASPGTSAGASTPAGSSAASAGPQPCATSALRAAAGSGNAAAGSSYYPIDLTNISGASCTLFGYPGVSFVTGTGGSQIGAAAIRSPGSAALVTLAPGATAHATLQVVDALNYPPSRCTLTKAHWLKIFPPGQFTALYLSFTAQACAAPHAAAILAVQPVAPGASAP